MRPIVHKSLYCQWRERKQKQPLHVHLSLKLNTGKHKPYKHQITRNEKWQILWAKRLSTVWTVKSNKFSAITHWCVTDSGTNKYYLATKWANLFIESIYRGFNWLTAPKTKLWSQNPRDKNGNNEMELVVNWKWKCNANQNTHNAGRCCWCYRLSRKLKLCFMFSITRLIMLGCQLHFSWLLPNCYSIFGGFGAAFFPRVFHIHDERKNQHIFLLIMTYELFISFVGNSNVNCFVRAFFLVRFFLTNDYIFIGKMFHASQELIIAYISVRN